MENETVEDTNVVSVLYMIEGGQTLVNGVLDLGAITNVNPEMRLRMERVINDCMVRTFGSSKSHKYGIGYLGSETNRVEFIPRVSLERDLFESEGGNNPTVASLLSALRGMGSDYYNCAARMDDDYLYVYVKNSRDDWSVPSVANRVKEIRIHKNTKTREESYNFWYNGLFRVVMKGISLLDIQFQAGYLNIPLKVDSKQLDVFQVNDTIHNTLYAAGLLSTIPSRDTLTDGSQFIRQVVSSEAFALDWIDMRPDGTSLIENPSPVIEKFQSHVREIILAGNEPPFREKTDPSMNVSFHEYLKNSTGFSPMVERVLNKYYLGNIQEDRIIDAVQDMDRKESTFLNKCLRIIEGEDPEQHKKLLLRSNPLTLQRNVEAYMEKRFKRQEKAREVVERSKEFHRKNAQSLVS